MSKYIDADKLIALIDTKLEDLGLSGSVWVGRSVLQELKNDIITSLQQEQPKKGLEVTKFCQPVPENIADCVAEHFWEMLGEGEKEDANTTETHPQQEHPEVDLWKEIHRYFNPHGMELQFDRSKGNTILKPEQLIKFSRHFYELGLNARKKK